MDNSLCTKCSKPPLQDIPLRLKDNPDYSSLFSFDSCAVAVQYWVLRPQTKDNC